ncbi:interleukin-17 receptor B [Tupaia chinensis]|uniref:interleukin-17 receptor B n=1 Tax=Tupaia chinensis TaxID=246437 RepID=UPI0007044636|nr:interleukin-17 receptor B [Tupaia chinensis]
MPREPTVQCEPEPGPSPEWFVKHNLTPGDLRDLQVKLVKTSFGGEDYSIVMNVSWILRADASICSLKATKICVTGKSNFHSYSCVRCDYTEAFRSQTRPSGGKWAFFYAGFPVELNTHYFIGAHNIPNANMNEDGPSMSVNFTSPGCSDHIMKYQKKCIEAGSLWDPNITACKKNEEEVEVSFTPHSPGKRYMVLILQDTIIGDTMLELQQDTLTRTSTVISVTGESEGAVVQLTPYFPTCGNDCIRRRGAVLLCPPTTAHPAPGSNRSVLGDWLSLLLLSLLAAVWVLAVGVYLMWRHERIKKASFPSPTLLPSIRVLVVYPPEVCFLHTICPFTEFLQNHCRSEVILEKWQRKKIADMGPVQWLTAQKQAADRVIFLLSNEASAVCEGPCGKSEGSPGENSQDLFPLAFNLFCSDLRSQAQLHKYMVVYFREADPQDDHSALSVCPQYRLMEDATAFCKGLHVKQPVSAGRRSPACHSSCCSL